LESGILIANNKKYANVKVANKRKNKRGQSRRIKGVRAELNPNLII